MNMKMKILAVELVVLFVSLLFFHGQKAQADIQPVIAVGNVYTAINAGEVDTAADLFAEDAVVENWVRGETYVGVDEIRLMLAGLQKDGRQFDIVNVVMAGDTITSKVEVSDKGIVWGTETIVAEVSDGKLQTLQIVEFRLDLWKATE